MLSLTTLVAAGIALGGADNSTTVAMPSIQEIPEGTSTHTIYQGSTARTFIVNRPAGATALVLLFHGLTSNAEFMCGMTDAVNVGAANGFITVCPQGLGNSWNAGACCAGNSADDVGFSRDIVDYVKAGAEVNSNRVYAAGYSNGGMMSYRLICQASDVFMGAGPACATYFGNVIPGFTCSPAVSRPVVALHGTFDPIVPYAPSFASYSLYVSSVGFCPAFPVVVFTNPAYFGMTCWQVSPCRSGEGNIWCQYVGLGHVWPENGLLRMWNYWTTGRLSGVDDADAALTLTDGEPLDEKAGAGLPIRLNTTA